MRHSLGEPLPHQLADTAQASLKAINLYRTRTLNTKIFLFKVHARAIKYYPVFRQAIPDFWVRTYLLLSRLPLLLRGVRLACPIHAASVHPELGSNSN